MHAELPKKGALASLKAFSAEYTMIVISILTALGLEHAATSWHHRHLAHEAAQRIDAEIAYNLKSTASDIAKNDVYIKKLTELRKFIKEGLNKSASLSGAEKAAFDATFRVQMSEKFNAEFSFGLAAPAFRREAWEVAVASQAAGWLEPVQLQRYSSIYATIRDVTPALNQSYATLTGPTVLGALPSLEIKSGVGPDKELLSHQKELRLYQMVTDTLHMLEFTQGSLRALETVIKNDSTKA